ncbi:MAG: lamin tail domain-containing protein [Nannocystis sp.]|nr:lamin tail domain-containing protein [Nannocystis sp.]
MQRRPPHPRRPLSLLALLALAGAACAGDDGDTSATAGEEPTCVAQLDAGALVITEIMADPDGADAGREWFEIYNASGDTVNLRDVVLTFAKADGTGQKVHTIAVDAELQPGQYFTLGDVLQGAAPAHVDYGYGADLGALNNSSGRVQVLCGKTIVDQVLFQDSKQKYTRSFTGALEPSAAQNDDQTQWCDAPELYSATDYGSPRAANPACPLPPPPDGQCYDGDQLRPIRAPRPGELVINEFHANSKAVDDTKGEWVELLALADVDLNGLGLGKEPGSVLQTIDPAKNPACVAVAAGEFALLARELDPAINGGLPDVDVKLTFSLNNTASGFFVANAAGDLIDAVTYPTTADGAASSLDPELAAAEANDDPAAFCPAQSPYGLGDLGTPRAVNPSCPKPPPEDECLEGGVWREIHAPEVGEVVINEIMADPAAAPDDDAEWLELYIGADIDLNRLMLGKAEGVVAQVFGADDPACLPVAAGTHLLLARDLDPALNGGLPKEASQLGFSLSNSAGLVWISLPGADLTTPGPLLDQAPYAAAKPGKSWRLDPGQQNILANDELANWCVASDNETYGLGDRGTPGAANGTCDLGGGGDGLCDDNGQMREPVAPTPGAVTITEYMPDPKAAPDASAEWFELRVNQPFDLNGLQLGRTPPKVDATLTSPTCLHVEAGDHLVFARSDDPALNGGLPQVDHLVGFSLVNSGGNLFAGFADEILDQVSYATSKPGIAASLDPNDIDWCDAADPYGLGDLGTPGQQNPACGVMPDPNLCTDPDDDVKRPPVPPGVGDLVITEFLADPKLVADAAGEWIEVYVKKDLDLNGLRIAKDQPGLASAAPLSSPTCLEASAGAYLLFAKNPDPLLNGGLPPVDYGLALSLTNTSGAITLGLGDLVIDTTVYTKAQTAGKSRALDPLSTDAALNDDADAIPWCVAAQTYGDGDFGTPKAENLSCN